jgi:hypothetical protein
MSAAHARPALENARTARMNAATAMRRHSELRAPAGSRAKIRFINHPCDLLADQHELARIGEVLRAVENYCPGTAVGNPNGDAPTATPIRLSSV